MGHSKIKTCKAEGCDNKFTPSFSTLQKYCSAQCTYNEHKKKDQKPKRQRINRVSKKQGVNLKSYSQDRRVFLGKTENKTCFIEGCNKSANTVEHIKGRKGYADDWARQNDVPLLLDQRFWRPCCLEHNLELENNPVLSQQYQLSKLYDGKKQPKEPVK